jgi:uncharacterized 2Fe-2S/4Fe-4S cluster protein (DUF4445 family)
LLFGWGGKMTVSITFEPSGINGVVAQGTYLIDAARRMGVSLGQGCTVGKGECPACVVSIKSGSEYLSIPSNAEEKLLGDNIRSDALRLACQVKIESAGDIVVAISAFQPRTETKVDQDSEVLKKFGDLPLTKKIATLMQLEAITMSEAFDSAMQKPLAFGSRAFDKIVEQARSAKAKVNQKSR